MDECKTDLRVRGGLIDLPINRNYEALLTNTQQEAQLSLGKADYTAYIQSPAFDF